MKTGKKKGFSLLSKAASAILSAALVCSAFVGLSEAGFTETKVYAAATTNYGLASTSQQGVILHCWNWSYNNIKKYMKDIAAAGYTSIQTSPVQQPKDYYWEGVAYGNVGIPNGTGGEDGNWWKFYQPVTFSICNNGHTWLGTKAEFKAMCDEAEKYGVKVIVDIVANHMGNIKGYKIGDVETVMGDISPQVGEFWKPEMLTDSSYWHISTSWTHSSDGRFDVTQGNMGMPDLNTGDTKVQNMVLGLLKECIDNGADGFRFDAAKHIETPADSASFSSNFWDVVLDGARAYYKQKNGTDGIFFYGEVLNRLDDTKVENYYLSKMSITDNSTSDNLRNSVIHGSVSALASSGYCGYIHGQADKAVMWAESHDTYMGGGSSYDASDADIKKTWVMLASRKDATALFFARPYYSKDILAGDVSKSRQSTAVIMENIGGEQTQLGDVGTLTWADPEVVAANRFRNFFVGQSERLGSSGNTAYNVRGNKGIVIVRGEGPGSIRLSVGMTDGTYRDQVTGESFKVSGGVITGNITNPNGIAVIYNPTVDYGTVSPEQPIKLKLSAATADGKNVFYTETATVTMKTEGATKVSYSTSEGKSGSFTASSYNITVGTYTATGEDVSVTMTATASDGTTKTKTYTFSKKVKSTEYPVLNNGGVVFDNSSYGWKDVYCYAYKDEGAVKNAAWPGVKMTPEMGDYFSYEYPSTLSGTINIIFNDGGGTQYPGSGKPGISVSSTGKKLFKSDTLVDLPTSVPSLKVTLKASASKVGVGQPITLTATSANASGAVKYTFRVNSGYTVHDASATSTCTWTPSAEGDYIIAVKAADDKNTVTATVKVKVSGEAQLTNTSTASVSGSTVTLKGSASAGKTPYQYTYCYKKDSASSWTTIKNYSTSTSASVTLSDPGKYNFCVKVKDSTDKVAKKYIDVTFDGTALNTSLTLSSKNIVYGGTLKATAKASGGQTPYEYAFFYKKSSQSSWTTLQSFKTNSSVTIKPKSTGDYEVCAKVRDKTGKIVKKYLSFHVDPAPLSVKGTVTPTTISLGNTVKVTGTASGGKGDYLYAFFYKKSTQSSWTTVQSFKSNSTVSIQPKSVGTYNICVKTKDKDETIAKCYYDITVTEKALSVSATLSSTSIQRGKSVKITATASGGKAPYEYAFFYKKTTESSWTTAQKFRSNSSLSPIFSAAGKYDICVKAKDSAGTIAKAYLTLTVKN